MALTRTAFSIPVLFALSALIVVPACGQETSSDAEPIVIGHRIAFHSEVLDADFLLCVGLPEGYELSTDAYPVVYSFDAGDRFPQVAAVVSHLASQTKMPRSILVVIDNPDGLRDPIVPAAEGLEALLTSRGADLPSIRFLKDELFPFIESRYRTLPHRTAIGHSANAWYITLRFLLQPELFSNYIASSIWVHWRDSTLVRLSRTALADVGESNRSRFFFSTGSLEDRIVPSLATFTELFGRSLPSGARSEYEVIDGETHNSVLFRAYLRGLEVVNREYALPADLTGWDVDRLRGHFAGYRDICGYDIGLPEDACIALGYYLLQTGETDKAVEVFKANIGAHPDSWNAFDSMGDALRVKGDTARAIESYRQSLELHPGNGHGRRALTELGG